MNDIKGSVFDCLDHNLYFIRIPPTVFIKTLASISAQQHTSPAVVETKVERCGKADPALLGPFPEF